MPKSTPTCNSIINLMYRAVAWANVADNAAASPFTNVYVSLHTAPLTPATNSQLENETAYTNYDRVAAARGAGFDAAAGGATANSGTLSFPQCGASGSTITDVATGTADLPSAGTVWHTGALNSPLAVANGITPQFAAGALTITES